MVTRKSNLNLMDDQYQRSIGAFAAIGCLLTFMILLIAVSALFGRSSRFSNRHISLNAVFSRSGLKFPTRESTEADESDECSICLENYKKGEQKATLPCKHEFHESCIERWIMHFHDPITGSSCPLCRMHCWIPEQV